MAGAPLGNKNACKDNRIFGDELRKAIAQDKRKRVRAGIEKLLDKVAEGDLAAFNAAADRTDGKPAQAVVGEDGGEIQIGFKNPRDFARHVAFALAKGMRAKEAP